MLKNLRRKIAHIICPEILVERRSIERMINIDALTSLPNRRAFDLAETSAIKEEMTFIIFDANSFGKVNKVCGHLEGDRLLIDIAAKLQEMARKYNCRVFRYAGDEFVAICHNEFAADIRNVMEENVGEIKFDNFTVSISGEIGSSVADADAKLQTRKANRKLNDQTFENAPQNRAATA